MKTHTHYLLIIISIIFSLKAQAQKKKSGKIDTVGVVMTMDDVMSNMCTYKDEPIKLASEDIWWYNEDGKKIWRHQDEVKWLKVYDRVFLCIPRDPEQGDGLCLMEVIARNEKFFLVSWWNSGYVYYVFDIHGNAQIRGIRDNHKEKIIEDIKVFFKDCPELTNRMKDNFDKPNTGTGFTSLYKGIKNLQCSENALSIESITDMLDKKPWYV